MEQIYCLTAIKREFDGYDRWVKSKIKMIDVRSNLEREVVRMNDADISALEQVEYLDIQMREATTEEIHEFVNKQNANIQTWQGQIENAKKDIEQMQKQIEAAKFGIRCAMSV
jgi:hypothetical protein